MDPNPSGLGFLFVSELARTPYSPYSHLRLYSQFIGTKGERTLFTIKARSLVRINDLSSSGEEEILLLPGTPLVVKSCLHAGNGLTVIQVGGGVGFTWTLTVTLIPALTLLSLLF